MYLGWYFLMAVQTHKKNVMFMEINVGVRLKVWLYSYGKWKMKPLTNSKVNWGHFRKRRLVGRKWPWPRRCRRSCGTNKARNSEWRAWKTVSKYSENLRSEKITRCCKFYARKSCSKLTRGHSTPSWFRRGGGGIYHCFKIAKNAFFTFHIQ